MTTCKTCKHWYTKDTKIKDRGICLLTTSSADEDKLTANDDSLAIATALVISSFGYKFVTAQLETSSEFGCNQWLGK